MICSSFNRSAIRKYVFLSSLTLLSLLLVLLLGSRPVWAGSNIAKIHLINLPGNSEAVVLEARDAAGNPVFGMIDTGEDEDFPKGTDARYPLRSGIIMGHGNEEQVYPFLSSIGVNDGNLKFLICTHPHSDHVGLASEIIRKYKPQTVYLMEYSDSCLSNKNALWDNLYIYDKILDACSKTPGVTLIQDIASHSTLSLGAFSLNLVNYDNDYMTNQKTDCNQFCLGVIACANGHTAFLSSDIDNSDGDETRLLDQYPLNRIDLLISNHHGYGASSPDFYLNSLAPRYFFQDGTFKTLADSVIKALVLQDTKIFSAGGYYGTLPALTADFSGSEVTCNADGSRMIYLNNRGKKVVYEDGKLYTGLFTTEEGTYCADENGILRVSGSWTDLNTGITYTFDADGKVTETKGGYVWVKINNTWYYRDEDGKNASGFVLYNNSWYYLDPKTGVMLTGWQLIDNKWYFFTSWGAALSGWQYYNKSWYYLNPDDKCAMLANTWFEDVDGYVYHLQSWGAANCNSTAVIDGRKYTFDKSCRVTNIAWLKQNDAWYLLANSKYYHGWAKLPEGYYFLNSDGTLKQNELYYENGFYYYSDQNGLMASNKWVEYKGNWYYFRSWGAAYTDCWFLSNKIYYWFDFNGVMATGWREINDKTYYFRSWGGMVTGTYAIDGLTYEFSKNGDLINSPNPEPVLPPSSGSASQTHPVDLQPSTEESTEDNSSPEEKAEIDGSSSEDETIIDSSSQEEETIIDSSSSDEIITASEEVSPESDSVALQRD